MDDFKILVTDSYDEGVIDPSQWQVCAHVRDWGLTTITVPCDKAAKYVGIHRTTREIVIGEIEVYGEGK